VTNNHIVLGNKLDEREKFGRKLQLVKILDSVPTEYVKTDFKSLLDLTSESDVNGNLLPKQFCMMTRLLRCVCLRRMISVLENES